MKNTIKGIAVLPPGNHAGICDLPIPKLRPGYVLIKVTALAINPTDWKHVDFGGADPGSRVGCEYAGVVQQLGEDISNFRVGDRIAGFVRGG